MTTMKSPQFFISFFSPFLSHVLFVPFSFGFWLPVAEYPFARSQNGFSTKKDSQIKQSMAPFFSPFFVLPLFLGFSFFCVFVFLLCFVNFHLFSFFNYFHFIVSVFICLNFRFCAAAKKRNSGASAALNPEKKTLGGCLRSTAEGGNQTRTPSQGVRIGEATIPSYTALLALRLQSTLLVWSGLRPRRHPKHQNLNPHFGVEPGFCGGRRSTQKPGQSKMWEKSLDRRTLLRAQPQRKDPFVGLAGRSGRVGSAAS